MIILLVVDVSRALSVSTLLFLFLILSIPCWKLCLIVFFLYPCFLFFMIWIKIYSRLFLSIFSNIIKKMPILSNRLLQYEFIVILETLIPFFLWELVPWSIPVLERADPSWVLFSGHRCQTRIPLRKYLF